MWLSRYAKLWIKSDSGSDLLRYISPKALLEVNLGACGPPGARAVTEIGIAMDEKTLLKLWNEKRTQIITAQISPALVLIGVMTLAAYGKFSSASDSAKYLALGVAAVTGILAMISQYAAIREAEALIVDLTKLEKRTALASKIADSRGLLSLSAIAIVGMGLAIFALVTWAVLG